MPIALIVIGLLFLVGVVALAMSGGTWRWYHITFGSFLLIFTVVLLYLAARTLKIETAWRTEIVQYEKHLTEEDQKGKSILAGGPDAEGKEHLPMDQLKSEVAKLQQGRGRVWGMLAGDVTRRATTPEGVLTVTVPANSGIEKGTVLYLFDRGAAPTGQFVGQFDVTDARGQEIQLTPWMNMRPDEQLRIAQRRGPFVLYEVMPHDDNQFSADVAAKLPNTVPADVKQEFLKDGKPPEAGEKQTDRILQRVRAVRNFEVTHGQGNAKETQMVSEGAVLWMEPKLAEDHIKAGDVERAADENGNELVYVRPMRDYAQVYRDMNLQIESVLASTAETTRQLDTVVKAGDKVAHDLELRNKEKTALTGDKAHYLAEQALVTKHANALATEVAEVRNRVKQLITDNLELEARIRRIYRAVADRINQQSGIVDGGR